MRSAYLILGVIALVSAQGTNTTTCCNVAPASVEVNTRLSWCRAQTNTCPELCLNGQTTANTCDACDEWKKQCIGAHPNDLQGQRFCLSFVCGQRSAADVIAKAKPNGTSNSTSVNSSNTSGSSTRATNTPSNTSRSEAGTVTTGYQYGTWTLLLGVSSLFTLAF